MSGGFTTNAGRPTRPAKAWAILLDGADGKEERELVGKEALCEAGVDRARGEVVGRDREDHALAGLKLANDGVDVVFVLEDAAVVLLLEAGGHLAHLHRPRILERRLRRAAETFTVCANEGCAARGRAVVRTNKGPSCFPAWRARSKKGLLL